MADRAEPETTEGPAATKAAGGARVFISYASADKAAADSICAGLERGGIACWIAPRDVTPGVFYADAIVDAINSARILIVVLSVNSVRSQHVLREVERASAKRRPLIAFRLDTTPLPTGLEYFLSASHWLDASAGTIEHALPELVTAVHRLLGAPEMRDPGAGLRGDSSVNARDGVKVISEITPKPRAKALSAATIAVVLLLALLAGKFWLSNRYAPQDATAPVVAVAPATNPALPTISDKSIAVLPFTDMSEKKDQEYFADGLSEELIDLLTKVPDLHVPARTSSFYFKGRPEKIAEIAKALSVANVLEGSVRKSGNALRVTAHLIRVDSGYDVWSQSYDRNLKDIFQVQDEIAGAVAQSLKAQLLTNSSPTYRTSNTDAYSLFLQGRYLNAQITDKALRRAAEILQRAVALDPAYAPAWAELAQSYVSLAGYIDADEEHDMEAGRAAVQKALALNPADAAAHYLLATIKVTFEHDWNGAIAEMEAARRADPDLTEPVELVFVTGCGSGPCHEKYIRDISRDIEHDPFNGNALGDRAYSHYYAGELVAAEADMRRANELSPNQLGLTLVLIAEHRPTEALPVVKGMPDSLYRRAGLAFVYQALGRKADADLALRELLRKDSQDGCFQIADVYAMRGDMKSALEWLQRDYDRKMFGILDAKVDPLFKPLAHEPRFIALMNKFAPSQ